MISTMIEARSSVCTASMLMWTPGDDRWFGLSNTERYAERCQEDPEVFLILQISVHNSLRLCQKYNEFIGEASMAPRTGLEPVTCPLGGGRAILCATGASARDST